MTAASGEQLLESLRKQRALPLASEAIGWLHMTGKAHRDFLRMHGKAGVSYDEKKDWHAALDPDWSTRLAWVRAQFPSHQWPTCLADFLHCYADGKSQATLVGLLQAGHAMASGIEKQSYPQRRVEYLGQDATHMWLATAFGHPVRNLLTDAPEVLTSNGWLRLVERVGHLLDELARLGSVSPQDAEPWWLWREAAIGAKCWLHRAFTSTLAETRLPNNDVTLWDQSYVAAALFKSAVAGAMLSSAPHWQDLKSQTRWRVLTVGFGTDHYEARAVRIGDWVGAQREIEAFFVDVRRLVEVDLAIGSLVYRDDQVLAFTFPGLRLDATTADAKGSLDDAPAEELCKALEKEIDCLAAARNFETPPSCRHSCSTRSFISMAAEVHEVRKILAVPCHRSWSINETDEIRGHVCPICQLRFNGQPAAGRPNVSKQAPCSVCRKRRRGRLDEWLASGEDTIWISEVADENDRVALLTFSFDLEPWLDGSAIDSLRAQSVAEWRRFNPYLEPADNPVDRLRPDASLVDEIKRFVSSPVKSSKGKLGDPLLASLNDGFKHEEDIQVFFRKAVEDRAGAPKWSELQGDDEARARWLAHQLFRKNASPGRIHRFWRSAETFFDELLPQIREAASAEPNRWRTRRLVLAADSGNQQPWQDRETYAGRFGDAPLEVLYRATSNDFLTICNLARVLRENETQAGLRSNFNVTGDDGVVRQLKVVSAKTVRGLGAYSPVVVLDRSPERFRVLVPLRAVNACIDAVVEKWERELARVWDRLPLRVGGVAFPRRTPFQAVIEAARNVEESLIRGGNERWRIADAGHRDGVTSLSVARADGTQELVMVPSRLPDGRPDVFYPYVRAADSAVRHPRDFATPGGTVYRHVTDLVPGDALHVAPARLAVQFMDSTAARFEPVPLLYLADWRRLRDTWCLLKRVAPGTTALRAAWGILASVRETWGGPLSDGEAAAKAWLEFARAVLAERLGARGPVLDALVDAAASGILERTLEWHLRALKQPLEDRP